MRIGKARRERGFIKVGEPLPEMRLLFREAKVVEGRQVPGFRRGTPVNAIGALTALGHLTQDPPAFAFGVEPDLNGVAEQQNLPTSGGFREGASHQRAFPNR